MRHRPGFMNLELGISDVKKPYVPNFGYKDSLTYVFEKELGNASLRGGRTKTSVGWALITQYVASTGLAPKYEGVSETIKKLATEK